jgi:hypothetical protein
MVVLPFGFPGGTGFGSAEKTTPGAAELLGALEEDDDVLDSVAGRSQPVPKSPARVRQMATTPEILGADDRLFSVSMPGL